jgi:hypothetical protein
MINYAVLGRTLALTLAVATPASAQSIGAWPQTVKLHDNATGKPIGTVTKTAGDNKFYVRDAKGEFVGTIVMDPKTKARTYYDPSGNVVEPFAIKPDESAQ